MQQLIQPVVLCGGAGTRLWPASRGERAKQFLDIVDDASLFARTLARVADRGFADPLIVCGPGHVAAAREQARDRPISLLVEPAARNTAAAIALAVASSPSDALLLVMPSDHVIADVPAFHAAVERGASLARENWLVTFGITPDRPDTGFGYIKSGPALREESFAVERFVEKPPLAEAEAMLSAGGYSWNAGIFLFRSHAMRDAMRAHCPAILEAAERAIAASRVEGMAVYADREAFEAAPADSIDYAVMEKHDRVAVVPVTMGWSDLGSWHAVHRLSMRDEAENAVSGEAFLHDSRGCLVRAGGRRVSLIGMEDIAVVVDGDDILVMPLARSQDVRAAAKAHD
jgi:mannose-1-phosphate guanylyltransferase